MEKENDFSSHWQYCWCRDDLIGACLWHLYHGWWVWLPSVLQSPIHQEFLKKIQTTAFQEETSDGLKIKMSRDFSRPARLCESSSVVCSREGCASMCDWQIISLSLYHFTSYRQDILETVVTIALSQHDNTPPACIYNSTISISMTPRLITAAKLEKTSWHDHYFSLFHIIIFDTLWD